MNVAESNHLVKLLRYMLDPGAKVPEQTAAEAVEYLAERARKTLLTGMDPAEARELFESDAERLRANAEQRAEDHNWREAVDWLINSRHVDTEALAAFWCVADGHATREQATSGYVDGKHVLQVRAEYEGGEYEDE